MTAGKVDRVRLRGGGLAAIGVRFVFLIEHHLKEMASEIINFRFITRAITRAKMTVGTEGFFPGSNG